MILLALTAPYLAPMIVFLSLIHAPFVAPIQNANGIVPIARGESPCVEDVECWSGFYRALMDLDGAAVALSDLKARTLSREPAHEYCHEILHDIGARAYEEADSVAIAYQGGDPFCRAGFYHGVLEGAFVVEGDDLMNHLDELCRGVPGKERYSYQYFSCVHGIGHGLMAFLDGDLFGALDGCSRLQGEWESISCAGGVFMENAARDPGEFRDDDPLYPCTAVGERFVDACYQMQSSHILAMNGGDFAEAFDVCRVLAQPRRTICFESIGRDASGYSRGDSARAAQLCSSGADTYERDHCMIGAAVDFIQTQGADGARALCDRAEGSALCRSRVNEQLAFE